MFGQADGDTTKIRHLLRNRLVLYIVAIPVEHSVIILPEQVLDASICIVVVVMGLRVLSALQDCTSRFFMPGLIQYSMPLYNSI